MRQWLWHGCAVGIVLLAHGLGASLPVVRDVGAYGYVAWRMAQGDGLYAEVVTSKFPGIFLLWSGLFQLAGPTETALKLAALVASLGSVAAFTCLARCALGSRHAGPVSVALALALCHPGVQGATAQLEVFMLPLIGLGAALLAHGTRSQTQRLVAGVAFAAGLSFGAALLIKQVAAPFILAGGIVLWLGSRDRWRRLGAYAVGACLPLACWCAWAMANESFGDFVSWTLLFPREYVRQDLRLATLWRVARSGLLSFSGNPGMLLGGLAWRGWRGWRRDPHLGVWMAAAFLAALLPLKDFRHYFLLVAPWLALASVELWFFAEERFPQRQRLIRGLGCCALALPLVTMVAEGWRAPYRVSAQRAQTMKFWEARQIGLWLRKNTLRDETVFHWGADPAVNFYAQRRSPTPYALSVLFSWHVPDDAWEQVIGRLRQDPPGYLVLSQRRLRPQIQAPLEITPQQTGTKQPLGFYSEMDGASFALLAPGERNATLTQAVERFAANRYALHFEVREFAVYRRRDPSPKE